MLKLTFHALCGIFFFDAKKGRNEAMKSKLPFGVGDIVTPFKGFSFGYGYTRFYRVVAIGNKFFVGRPLCTDFSPLGNGSEQLSIIRFKFYRKGVCHV